MSKMDEEIGSLRGCLWIVLAGVVLWFIVGLITGRY